MADHQITPRRRDRALTDDKWMAQFLHEVPTGVITTSVDGQPYSNINTFVYDSATHAIYIHTAGQGRLRREIEANPLVCVSASRMGRLLPADTAREFSVEYESIVVFGRASIVTDTVLATTQMQCLIDKYFDHLKVGKDYRPITEPEILEITVVRIDIDSWSGKGKFEAEDFPGAFQFGCPPESTP